jgi:2-polyprenyl-3-methyl-5-hydroxy-6-metoxy-1,4-benzoquinol methylase
MKALMERLESCVFCKGGDFSSVEEFEYEEIVEPHTKEAIRQMELERVRFCFCVCNSCGLIFMNPQWSREGIRRFYRGWYESILNDKTSYVNVADTTANLKKILYLASFNPRIEKVLDVGCGVGHFLDACRSTLGKRVILCGIEIEPEGAEIARRKGYDVTNVDILDFNPEMRRFDLIVFNSVIEHLKNPFEVISKSLELLRPGGVLYLNVPNADSLNTKCRHLLGMKSTEYILEHLYYFRDIHFKGADKILFGNPFDTCGIKGLLNRLVGLATLLFPSRASQLNIIYVNRRT